MTAEANPRVFISYASEDDRHRAWVRGLAEQLVSNGIEVTLDQWHLQPGGDVAHFMQEGIDNAEYLLLICTPVYASKFDSRESGVGDERDLILGELLTSHSERGRIIPLLRSGRPSSALPRYLKTKLYVDFSSDDNYDYAFEQLIRRLYNTPKLTPPKLGSAPSFVRQGEAYDVLSTSPATWVLVAGSGRRSGELSDSDFPEKIRQTCDALGKLLAHGGYGVITGGWKGVDETVARVFARELARERRPLEDRLTQVVAETKMPSYPAGNLILVKEGREEWIEGIRLANAVILIGGRGGTRATGEFALEAGKAVFPLADTGGDAKDIYLFMLSHWSDDYFARISRKKFLEVTREAPDVIGNLDELLRMTECPDVGVGAKNTVD
jgi:hypothetical protein